MPESDGGRGGPHPSEAADEATAALHALARNLPDRINADPEHV